MCLCKMTDGTIFLQCSWSRLLNSIAFIMYRIINAMLFRMDRLLLLLNVTYLFLNHKNYIPWKYHKFCSELIYEINFTFEETHTFNLFTLRKIG